MQHAHHSRASSCIRMPCIEYQVQVLRTVFYTLIPTSIGHFGLGRNRDSFLLHHHFRPFTYVMWSARAVGSEPCRDRFYSYHWVPRVRALKAPRQERRAMPPGPNFLVHWADQLVSANLTTTSRLDLTRASLCNRSSSSCTASSSSGDILDMSASSISCQEQLYEHNTSRQSNYQSAITLTRWYSTPSRV